MDNLPELRDIHLPDGVSAFPPAYGWWLILAAIILVVVLFEVFKILRQKSKKRYALLLLSQAKSANIILEAREMSEILRRICLVKYPNAAALFDKDWIEFLNAHSKSQITGKALTLLIDAPYINPESQNFSLEDINNLRSFCQSWIGENL